LKKAKTEFGVKSTFKMRQRKDKLKLEMIQAMLGLALVPMFELMLLGT